MSVAFHTIQELNPEEFIIEYAFKRLKDINKIERTQLEKLTLINGCMKDWLWACDSIADKDPVVVATAFGKIIGWSMLRMEFEYDSRLLPCVGVYVDKAYRGHGLAKKLVTTLLNNTKDSKLTNVLYVARARKLYAPLLCEFGLTTVEMY